MILDSAGKISGVLVMQEVVVLNLTESGIFIPAMIEQSASIPDLSDVPCIAVEIKYGNIRVRIFYCIINSHVWAYLRERKMETTKEAIL